MKKGFYFGFQITLFRDREGLKLFSKFWLLGIHREKMWMLRKDPNWKEGNPDLTPKMDSPEVFAEMPEVTLIEPEDMNTGISPTGKVIEPEDM